MPEDRAAKLAAEFGLSPEEHARALAILGRLPTLTESRRGADGGILSHRAAARGARRFPRPRER